MTNNMKLTDFTSTASLDRNCLYSTKKDIIKLDQSVKMPWHRLSMGVACSHSSAPGIGAEQS